jgi:hypothetical protein
MLVSGSGNYGTVNIKAAHRNRKYKVKVYPRMVHVIKSFNIRLQGSIPKTLQGIRNQLASALRMIHNLASKDNRGVEGFRIEVTVKAKSLQEAHRLVNDTSFLDPSYWLKAGDGHVARRGLTAKLVTREGLLANANWVYNQAAQSDIFTGAAANKPSKEQIQAIVDILNDLGWNAGIRRPTKSLDPNAWWHATPQRIEQTSFGSSLQTISLMTRSGSCFREPRRMPSFMLCLARRNLEIKIIAIKSTTGVLSEFDAPTKIAVVN